MPGEFEEAKLGAGGGLMALLKAVCAYTKLGGRLSRFLLADIAGTRCKLTCQPATIFRVRRGAGVVPKSRHGV
jgi:hypothetical protein